jgi:hypothetical protein
VDSDYSFRSSDQGDAARLIKVGVRYVEVPIVFNLPALEGVEREIRTGDRLSYLRGSRLNSSAVRRNNRCTCCASAEPYSKAFLTSLGTGKFGEISVLVFRHCCSGFRY